MKVEFLKKFLRDIDKITNSKDKKNLFGIIEAVKSTDSLSEISGIKKLKGFDDAYRIRCGDYRIGVFIESETVLFARVAHRKEIYRIFP